MNIKTKRKIDGNRTIFKINVSFDTQSDENSGVTPTYAEADGVCAIFKIRIGTIGLSRKFTFGMRMVICLSTWPANTDKPVPAIGFIATHGYQSRYDGCRSPPHALSMVMMGQILYCVKKTTLYFLPSNFPNCWIIKGRILL